MNAQQASIVSAETDNELSNWESTRLGDILEETNFRVKDVGNDDSAIPVLSITRYGGLVLQSDKFGKRIASKDIKNYKIVRRNELVYGFPIDEGVIYFLKGFEIGALSPVYVTWRKINANVDTEFLDLLLKTPQLIEVYRRFSSNTVHRRRIISAKDF